MTNRALAEMFLCDVLPHGVPVMEHDLARLEAMLDIAEERGELRSGWLMDEPTKPYNFDEEVTT